jgi:hypothetical protein
MRAVFVRLDAPDTPVGEATWDGHRISFRAEGDESVGVALARVFRPTPVAVDDPALRTAGTAGPVVLPPGSLVWFQAAARVRGFEEGLAVRLLPDGRPGSGWDPAGAYRPFGEAAELRERTGVAARTTTA